jgi:hypothetical protein
MASAHARFPARRGEDVADELVRLVAAVDRIRDVPESRIADVLTALAEVLAELEKPRRGSR